MKSKKNKQFILQRIRILYSQKRIRKNKHIRKRDCHQSSINKELEKNELIRKKRFEYINNQSIVPRNLWYILHNDLSPFYYKKIKEEKYKYKDNILVPEEFSIIENSQESFDTLKQIVSALIIEDYYDIIRLDYSKCAKIGLDAQIILDIILKDYLKFASLCKQSNREKKKYFTFNIGGQNINNINIKKILFSVGSPSVLGIKQIEFKDVEKYCLCIHDNDKYKDTLSKMNQKDLDTTDMADYVIRSLQKMKRTITSDKRDDLCTVIGEILINAEEHSTTKYRFSVGYFNEEYIDEKHCGVFRLVILNFGQTIYEKFKSNDCPNKDVVNQMDKLSKDYVKNSLFSPRKFEEETLWTLYALQEGITSIPNSKRGNGSIRFIDSFFNIKGSKELDNISMMAIVSGKSRIIFDGKYEIVKKIDGKEIYKVMTFNNTGKIEDKPDNQYVYNDKYYFPGTLISARILLNDNDIVKL
jgi:hypothetical protein